MLVGRGLFAAADEAPVPTLSVSATNVNATDSGATSSGSVSGQSTATPSGAQGSVTYLWEHISTSSGNTPNISSATAKSPTFTATVAHATNSVSTWRVTATDSVSSAQDTITVTLNWNDVVDFSVSATNVSESENGLDSSDPVSGSSTATPSGNVGTVVYSWSHISTASGNTPSISGHLTATPTFTATVSDGVPSDSDWRVTAVDLADNSVAQDTIRVLLTYTQLAQVNVTNIFVSSSNPGQRCRSGVRYNNNGSIDELGPTLADENKIHNNEWWSKEPQANIGASYQVRCQSLTSGSWSTQAAAVGTWVDISTEPVWVVSVVGMASPDAKEVEAVFQIRRKSDNQIMDTFDVHALASN